MRTLVSYATQQISPVFVLCLPALRGPMSTRFRRASAFKHEEVSVKHLTRRGSFLSVLVLWGSAAFAEHYTLPLFVTSTSTDAVTGIVRILNMTAESGSVEIYAVDDAGIRSGPATLTLNASAAAEFSASDLVSGNAMKGVTGSIGTVSGDVRLEIDTDLRIVPAAYARAADGTLSTMHDTIAGSEASGGGYEYLVPIFNLSTEMTQASRLRLINPDDAAAAVMIDGRNDSGTAAAGTVQLTLAAGVAQTLTAQQLEAGDAGLTGQLGAGSGKWRLSVTSDRRLHVLNVVSSTSGYMNNLSTTAATGLAPQDHEAFNERFVDTGIQYQTESGDFAFSTETGDRFTETGESDGMSVSRTGGYAYEPIGLRTGRVTVSYENADKCTVNLHFSTSVSGWFASFCVGTEDPDGYWVAGNWSIADDSGDDGDKDDSVSYGVDDALPGVPTSGVFAPSTLGAGASVTSTSEGTTITLNDSAYFELADGTRYTCTSSDGCAITNGAVTRGTVTGTPPRDGEVDVFPTFRMATAPGNQTYMIGTAIDTLMLPQASSGNGTLTYTLSPTVPGLTFNPAARQLTGTPATAGSYAMTYTVTDEDGDSDTLTFTITVSDGTMPTGSRGVCHVGMLLSMGQSCTYPGTDDAFSVNVRGRGRFLNRLAGIRIRINNETIDGRVYDFEASHDGDGVWRIDRIEGSTVPPTGGGTGTGDTDSTPFFAEGAGPGDQTYTVGTAIETLALAAASGGDGALTYTLMPEVPGLTFDAATRQLTGTPTAAGAYAMTYRATDEDDDAATLSFNITAAMTEPGTGIPAYLDADDLNAASGPIGFANGRFYVLDRVDFKLYAYSATGQRDSAADINLDNGPFASVMVRYLDMSFVDGRVHVLANVDPNGSDYRVYAYTATGARDLQGDFELPTGDISYVADFTYANGQFHVLGITSESSGTANQDYKVFAYSASGDRVPAADFDLLEGSDSPEGIVYGANDRFHVLYDSSALAYTTSGERDPTADLKDVPGARSNWKMIGGIAYANGGFYVTTQARHGYATWGNSPQDNDHRRVYAFSATGERTPAADFDLVVRDANSNPNGIAYVDSRFFVLDGHDRRAYAYSDSGQRIARADVHMRDQKTNSTGTSSFPAYGSPENMTSAYGLLYVITGTHANGGQRVEAFSAATGEWFPNAGFSLGGGYYEGIAFGDGRFYLVGWRGSSSVSGRFMEVFSDTGSRVERFDIVSGASADAIAYANGRIYGVQAGSGRVLAFSNSGERLHSADIDLGVYFISPAVTIVNGQLLVVDGEALGSHKVYAFTLPTE